MRDAHDMQWSTKSCNMQLNVAVEQRLHVCGCYCIMMASFEPAAAALQPFPRTR